MTCGALVHPWDRWLLFYFHASPQLRGATTRSTTETRRSLFVPWKRRPAAERLLYIVTVGLYGIVMVANMICAVTDVALHFMKESAAAAAVGAHDDDASAGDVSAEPWVAHAMADEQFVVRLETW